MKLSPEMFIGAWSLNDWRIEYEDGRTTYPFGPDAAGQIVYSKDGQMSATVSATRRKKHGFGNTRNLPDAQKAKAFEGYFHYAGTWNIDEDHVVHHVNLALNPDFVGTQQRRRAEFSGPSKLRLSANESLSDGGSRHHILEWEK